MRATAAIILVAAAILRPAPAAAQSGAWTDAGYVTISGFYQTASGFSDLVRPTQFGEAAQVDTRYGINGLPGIDAGAGVRVWRNLALGVDVGFLSKSGGGSITAQMPHPFYFNRPRAVTGDASGLTRAETAVNIEALVMLPIPSRWQAAVFGGPTWFMVDQDLVTTVTLTEAYPFDAATFAGTTVVRQSRSKAGFNVGGDVSYMMRPHVGVGVDVRFSRARIALTDTATVIAGGPHVGGGLRLRF
jgi:Outer membrane protein beta-barrel domain